MVLVLRLVLVAVKHRLQEIEGRRIEVCGRYPACPQRHVQTDTHLHLGDADTTTRIRQSLAALQALHMDISVLHPWHPSGRDYRGNGYYGV